MMIQTLDEPRGRSFTRGAWGMIVALLIIRSLLNETIRDAGMALPGTPAGPGVTTMLLLDWLALLPVLLILARRLLDRSSFPLRVGVAHLLLAGLAVWAMLSPIWADDRFLAYVSSTRLLAAAAILWSVTQLVRRPVHVRLVAGLCVGLLLANVAHGLIARYVDQPDLAAFWRENRDTILRQNNWSPADYAAVRFEKKLLAGELFGFTTSPNTLAALVVTGMLVALAGLIERVRRREANAVVLAGALAGGGFILSVNDSKAAWATLLLGGGLIALWFVMRRLLTRQRALAFVCALSVIGLAVVSVMAIGLTRGGLPEDSLNFRWRYWIGAWRIVLDHPLAGVGWANFAEAYLPVRLPQAAEEITDPHNFAVRVAAELGGVGLALLLGWLITAAWAATRSIAFATTSDATPDRAPLAGLPITLLIAWFAGLLAANELLDARNGSYLFLDAMKRALLVGLIGIGIAAVLLRREAGRFEIDERPVPWLVVGIVVAVGMMLLQSTIDIAFFQTAPLLLVATMIGTAIGSGWRDRPTRPDSIPFIAISVACVAGLALFIVGVVPIGWAEAKAAEGARAMAERRPAVAGAAYASAYNATFPLNNVDYAARAAQAFVEAGPAYTGPASEWMTRATTSDPSNAAVWFTRARIGRYWRDANVPGAPPIDQILNDFAQGVALNPSDADLHLEFADLLDHFGQPERANAAIAEALRIDDALDPAEPERLDLRSPGRRQTLLERLSGSRSATAPAER